MPVLRRELSLHVPLSCSYENRVTARLLQTGSQQHTQYTAVVKQTPVYISALAQQQQIHVHLYLLDSRTIAV